MEKDILNYSSTVMFRGTPCMFHVGKTVDINQGSRLTGNLTYSHIISNICLNTARWKGYGSVSDIYVFFDKQTFDTEIDIYSNHLK